MNVFILSIIVILSIISVNGIKLDGSGDKEIIDRHRNVNKRTLLSGSWSKDDDDKKSSWKKPDKKEKSKRWERDEPKKKKDCDCKKKDWAKAKVPDPKYLTYGICYVKPYYCKRGYCFVIQNGGGLNGLSGFTADGVESDPDAVDVEGDNDAVDVEADDDGFAPNGVSGQMQIGAKSYGYIRQPPCRYGEVVAFVTKMLKHGYILPYGFKPYKPYNPYHGGSKGRPAPKHKSSWYKQDHYGERYDGGYSKRGDKYGGGKYDGGDVYDGGDAYDGGYSKRADTYDGGDVYDGGNKYDGGYSKRGEEYASDY